MNITNSSSKSIFIVLSPSTVVDKIKKPHEESIDANSSTSIPLNTGTVKLEVWIDPSKDSVWKGFVPVGNVDIDSENRKVRVRGVEIPATNRALKRNWVLWIGIILLVLLLGFCFKYLC